MKMSQVESMSTNVPKSGLWDVRDHRPVRIHTVHMTALVIMDIWEIIFLDLVLSLAALSVCAPTSTNATRIHAKTGKNVSTRRDHSSVKAVSFINNITFIFISFKQYATNSQYLFLHKYYCRGKTYLNRQMFSKF